MVMERLRIKIEESVVVAEVVKEPTRKDDEKPSEEVVEAAVGLYRVKRL